MQTQNYKRLRSRGASLLILLLALAACTAKESTQPKKDIIGKWRSDDGTLTLEFTAQGKVHSAYGRSSGTSDVVFLDDTHILGVWELSMPVLEVHIRGSQMTFKMDNGKRVEFYRVK